MTSTGAMIATVAVVAALLGGLLGWLIAQGRYAASLAALRTERELLRERERSYIERLAELRAGADDDTATAAALAPLREAMTRVERQVGALERDRVQQYGALAERLSEVSEQTGALRRQTAGLAGALNASTVRGAWGETQLRRVCEHAGMLPRCDFEEQVRAVSGHDAAVRPDVVVRLPGDRVLVIDAKAPMSGFLSAQAEGVSGARRRELLGQHAASLRAHVDALAAKRYWSAFSTTPEMVICFIPADAMLAAALSADPALYDDAQSRKVVLASPATLLAMLRSIAFAWRQDALATSARELLVLGQELYERLGTMGGHLTRTGTSLRRAVDGYNALVGALEGRVFVTARRLNELGLAGGEPPAATPLESSVRPLTAPELLDPSLPEPSAAAAGARVRGAETRELDQLTTPARTLTDEDLALPPISPAAPRRSA